MFKCTILVGLCSRARKLTWEFSNLESNKMKMAVLICFINVCLRHILSNDI